MCYLTIKEMANISEDVIIVTSRFVPKCLNIDISVRNYLSWLRESISETSCGEFVQICCFHAQTLGSITTWPHVVLHVQN